MRDRAPARPWAMCLVGADQRFFAFDLDVLTGHLANAGIPFLVCASGPATGRRVTSEHA